jgi:prepilin signal peptidase PulO-like enzyme (type II secretory pathway)
MSALASGDQDLQALDAVLLLAAAVLLCGLPLLSPMRAAVARLLRKAYPGSAVHRIVCMLQRMVAPPVARVTVLDAVALSAIVMVAVAALAPEVPAPWLVSISRQFVVAGLGVVLVLLAAFDLRYRQLPDELTIPLAGLGLVVCWPSGLGIAQSLTGLIGAGGLLWLVRELHFRWRGVEGLGRGDIKLVAAMGAWLGPMVVGFAIAGAAFAALAAEASMQLARTGRIDGARRIPLGAYLAGAFWVAWLLTYPGGTDPVAVWAR